MDLQPEVHGLVYGSRTHGRRKPYALPAEAVRLAGGSRTLVSGGGLREQSSPSLKGSAKIKTSSGKHENSRKIYHLSQLSITYIPIENECIKYC